MDRFFQLSQRGTTIRRELLAGLTTFLTMSYILFMQPNILSQDFTGQPTGLRPGAVLLATCMVSAFASALMGLLARLPVALAPGMGQNFFFVTMVMSLPATPQGEPWRMALAIVFVAGIIFLLLTLVGLRDVVLNIMSPSMRSAIAVGIGLFIAFIGLKNAGVVSGSPTLVSFNASRLWSVDSGVFWTGLLATLVLAVRGIPGSTLIGIGISTAIAMIFGKVVMPERVFGLPEAGQLQAIQFDFRAVFTTTGAAFVAVLVFMDVFDTTGTLVGVTQQLDWKQQPDLMRDGELSTMRQAMLADAAGTVAGACLGTSTVTSYIESAAGIEQGGRTGLTALTTAALFLLAIMGSPLIIAVGSYLPITAPALVFVGAVMFRNVRSIDWIDETEAIPAFLVILGIPLFFSIADGIALGLVVWPLLKLVRGKLDEVPVAAYGLAGLLVVYFLFIRTSI